MNKRNLLLYGGIIVLSFGCTTPPPVENPQMLIKEDSGQVENSAENVVKSLVSESEPVQVADNNQAVDVEAMSCTVKGKVVMFDKIRIGINVQLGYCSQNLKPEGSDFWIPDAEAPMLGNIHVDDACNITYCSTATHYDHFGISNGKNSIQVQVNWQDGQPVIY
jgi:hypothetical protein